jgi:hypothetical protein
VKIKWDALDDQSAVTVPARPEGGLWTMVRTQLVAPAVIRIEASGSWRLASDLPACGADGMRHWLYGRDQLLTKKAPPGALIGKVGGSCSAADEADVFIVGSVTVLLLEKVAGPLYPTINGAPMHFASHEGELTVRLL